MKKITLILTILILTLISCEQSSSPEDDKPWSKTIGELPGRATIILSTANNEYTVCGDVLNNNQDFCFFNLKEDGNLNWFKSYDRGYNDRINSMLELENGDFIILGESDKDSLDTEGLILKINTIGDTLWTKIVDKGLKDQLISIASTTDSCFIISGYSEVSGQYTDGSDAFLMKIDSDGNEIWFNKYDSGAWEKGSYVTQKADGGYLLLCNIGESLLWIIHTDSEGNKTWDKTITNNYCHINSVVQLENKNLVIAGYKPSVYDQYFCLLEINTNGDVQWYKTYEVPAWNKAYSMIKAKDEGYLLVGYTSYNSLGYSDSWIIKTDSQGNKVWDKIIGGTGADVALSVKQLSNDNFLIAGWSSSFGSENVKPWLFKLDNSGNEIME
ncbi:MAG: hypothetical protein PF638_15870 [Candidatus Delongbacteria bacterium]|jgi:hypothetical protein|nr:hypothetical protein [Candidatus Delongbacteria bacterium]